MTGVTVGVITMPRTVLIAVAGLALVLAGLVIAGPAQAEWSRPGDLVRYKVCRTAAHGGEYWKFHSSVRRQPGTSNARAGIRLLHGDQARARWSSGWLDRGEVQVSKVRIRKSPKVRVHIWQEAGERDSQIGTSATATLLTPKQIRHC